MAADATPTERRQLLGSAFVDDGNAAAQTNFFGRRPESEWAAERAALGSRREYISPYIADLEDLARRQDAKGNGVGAALTRERANHWRDVLAELRKP